MFVDLPLLHILLMNMISETVILTVFCNLVVDVES